MGLVVLASNIFSMEPKFSDAVTTLPGERKSKLTLLGTYAGIGWPHFFLTPVLGCRSLLFPQNEETKSQRACDLPALNRGNVAAWDLNLGPFLSDRFYTDRFLGGTASLPVRIPSHRRFCSVFLVAKSIAMAKSREYLVKRKLSREDLVTSHSPSSPPQSNQQIIHTRREEGIKVQSILVAQHSYIL